MARSAIVFEASRNGYEIEQMANTAMTIGELKGLLEYRDDDELFILSNDNGYTYGSINSFECWNADEDEDGEWTTYK